MKYRVFLIAFLYLFPATMCLAQQQQLENCITTDQLGNKLDRPICTPVQLQTPQPQQPPQLPQKQPRVQYSPGGEVGVPKVMGVIGYTYQSDSTLTSPYFGGSLPSRGFNGFFIEPTVNISQYVAIIGHVDAAYHQETVASLNPKVWAWSYTAGPQVYVLAHRYAWQPFGRATFGAATLRWNSDAQDLLLANTNHETAFAYEVGGGLDYRSSSRWGWRVGELDYIHAKKTISGLDFTYTAVKLGVGVSF